MLKWIADNAATIVIVAALVAATALIIIKMVKERRSGAGGSCSCGCSGCAMSGMCHGGSDDAERKGRNV